MLLRRRFIISYQLRDGESRTAERIFIANVDVIIDVGRRPRIGQMSPRTKVYRVVNASFINEWLLR